MLTAVAVAAGSCTSAHTGSIDSPSPGASSTLPGSTAGTVTPTVPLVWTPCASGLECATVEVPLDYTKPHDRLVPIALQRQRATGPARLGALLLNPGGPGESGIDSMKLFQDILSKNLQTRFDLVAFDPRGTGRSEGVRCVDGPALDKLLDLDPAPATPAGLQALIDGDRSFVAGCEARSSDILPFVGTINAARDMDLIRAALGESRLKYLGFSYGTLLGAIYADLFPTHVGALVLDGAVDPALDVISSNTAQSVGFDHELGAFFDWCRATPSCAWTPRGDLHSAFDALIASIRAHPLPVGSRRLGAGEAYFAVAIPLYDRAAWPRLAEGLQAASSGDGSLALQYFDAYAQRRPDGTFSGTIEANTAINCADGTWPTDLKVYPGLAAKAAAVAPEFGPGNVYGSLTCAVWPVSGQLPAHAVRAAGSPPILVVGSTGDPATPYVWAKSLAGELEHGVLLTRVGEGHTAYPVSQCIRGFVDAYLLAGTSPPSGATCTP